MAWYNDLYESAKNYLSDRYLGGGSESASNIIKDATGAYTAYKSYEDQKRANEALESAYRDYTQDKAESQETINAALALGLQPMTVSNIPTTKADITEFTEVQDVAKGGLMSLPNKKRKKYGFGVGPNDAAGAITGTLEPEIEPNWFDLMYEEGVPFGEQVKNLIDNLLEQGVIDENTSEEELKKILNQIQQAKKDGPVRPIDIPWPGPENPTPAKKGGLMSLPNKKRKRYGWGPELEDIEETEEEVITPFDLQMEEGVPIGPMVQEPELVKPPWMTQEEWLNFQYSRNQAARGGIMKLRHGGRPGYQQGIGPNQGSPSIMANARTDQEVEDAFGISMDDTNVTEERTYPTDHKFWELVDWDYEDKKSKEKEDAINADMEAGMAWEDIEKKYNLKSFEDVSITETEREETDSGSKVKELFETIKGKVTDTLKGYSKSKEKHVKDSLERKGIDMTLEEWKEVPLKEKLKQLNYLGVGQFLNKGGRPGYADGTGSRNRMSELMIKLSNGTITEEEKIELRNIESASMFAQGGRIKKDNGGIMNLGGMEKDYRTTGGFVPIGAYERKDDVPARLSKNEFVMTADAVRAAGGGSIKPRCTKNVQHNEKFRSSTYS